jgi:hypothetical protein
MKSFFLLLLSSLVHACMAQVTNSTVNVVDVYTLAYVDNSDNREEMMNAKANEVLTYGIFGIVVLACVFMMVCIYRWMTSNGMPISARDLEDVAMIPSSKNSKKSTKMGGGSSMI